MTLKPKFVEDAIDNKTLESQKDHSKAIVKSQHNRINVTNNMLSIIEIIKKNPYITTTEIAKQVNLKRETISGNISKMKKLDLNQRVGDDKTGHWNVGKKSNNPFLFNALGVAFIALVDMMFNSLQSPQI